MKKIDYLKHRLLIIKNFFETYTGNKVVNLERKINAAKNISKLEKLTEPLIEIYHCISDVELKRIADKALQHSHILGRDDPNLILANADVLLSNLSKTLKDLLAKPEDNSLIRFLCKDIYRLIALHLENNNDAKTLMSYSLACRMFRDVSKKSRDRLKEKNPDCVFKIMLLGDAGAGKTAFGHRYLKDNFSENPVINSNIDSKSCLTNNKRVKFKIRDELNSSRYSYIGNDFYNGVDGFIVFFDLTDPSSFANVQSWLSEIDRYGQDDAVKVLVGTKNDLIAERAVDSETIQEFVYSLDLDYFETSAKTGENISQVFEALGKELINQNSGTLCSTSAFSLMLK